MRMKRVGGRLVPFTAKLTHDRTLVEWIADSLVTLNMRVGAVDKEAGTIRIASTTQPAVVHEIKIRRVS